MTSTWEEHFPYLKETIERFVKRPWSRPWRAQYLNKKENEIRYLPDHTFSDFGALVHWINKNDVIALHLSSYQDPKEDNRLLKSELVFDVDLDSFVEVRELCNCQQTFCQRCWAVAMFGARVIHHFLKNLLEFEQVYFFFSGRRGFHVWVLDDSAVTLDSKKRLAILDFMSLSTAFGQTEQQFDQRRQSTAFAKELYQLFADDVEQLTKQHFPEFSRRRFFNRLQLFWPRFDRRVTSDYRTHTHRLPLGNRAETGFLCREFDPIEEPYFNPTD